MSLKTLGGLFNGKNKSHNQKKLDQCLHPVFRIRKHYIMQIRNRVCNGPYLDLDTGGK